MTSKFESLHSKKSSNLLISLSRSVSLTPTSLNWACVSAFRSQRITEAACTQILTVVDLKWPDYSPPLF